MNDEAKLGQLIGSYSDKNDLVLQMDKESLNIMAKEALTIIQNEGLDYEDVSGFKIIHLIRKMVTHPDLESEYVGKSLVAIINNGSHPRFKKDIYSALNHPNINQEDFIVGLKFIYSRGIIFNYSESEVELKLRPQWSSEIDDVFVLYLPQLKDYLVEARLNIFDVIYKFITTFYKYSPTSLENSSFITQFELLINKLSPDRLSRLTRESTEEIKQINPAWSNHYYKAERLVLEKVNSIKYSPPGPYGTPRYGTPR